MIRKTGKEPSSRKRMVVWLVSSKQQTSKAGQRSSRVAGRGWKTVGRQQDKEGWPKKERR